MSYPNALIFVDLSSDDPSAAGKFYAEVFGWVNEGRPEGVYHRLVPGQNFRNPDGSESQIGNLHLGISNSNNARPYPDPEGADPRHLSKDGRKARIWIMVSDDDTPERILDAAEKLGAEILWRDHYWSEFNGYNYAFRDPWGNEIVLWGKAGENPQVPDNFTRE
ncbi:MAG: putative enzyme related to lactoylglutathione lyase [Gammaproteobacteria bacterium]|jgi:predicted enzyme related to lactoylglutathione lyase